MDPNAALAEALRIATRIIEQGAEAGDAERMADLLEAIDLWIRGGGFLPDRWARLGRVLCGNRMAYLSQGGIS